MLAEKINANAWKQTMMKKLISFCDKCPCVLSVKTGTKGEKDGVFIIHKNTMNEYFFPFDIEKDPKEFIHEIKEFIKPKHYPILVEEVENNIDYTPEELAIMIEEGKDINSLPNKKSIITKVYWQIDKVILWKNIAILTKINPVKSQEGMQYRYKYNKSLIVFLKKYRSGEFKSIEDAGREFFDNSLLINEINQKPIESL